MWGLMNPVAHLPAVWQFAVSTWKNKKLIRRWDSKRELSYDDIVRVLQNTIDSCIPPQIDAAVICGTHVYQIQWNNAM